MIDKKKVYGVVEWGNDGKVQPIILDTDILSFLFPVVSRYFII